MASAVLNSAARPASAAPTGLSLAIGFNCALLRGVGACLPSGALRMSRFGTGIGIGIFEFGSMIVTKYWVASVRSYDALKESQFDVASKLMLPAGCGPPNILLRSGPQ